MRYSSWKKTQKTIQAKRSYLIKEQRKSADCKSNKPDKSGNARGQSGQVPITSRTASTLPPRGSVLRTCHAGISPTASQTKSKSPLDKFPPMWYTIANRYTRSISHIHKNRIFTHIVSRRYISVSRRRCVFFLIFHPQSIRFGGISWPTSHPNPTCSFCA